MPDTGFLIIRSAIFALFTNATVNDKYVAAMNHENMHDLEKEREREVNDSRGVARELPR